MTAQENLAQVIAKADDATLDYERRRPDYDKEPWEGYVPHADAVLAFLTSDEAVDRAADALAKFVEEDPHGASLLGMGDRHAGRAALLGACGVPLQRPGHSIVWTFERDHVEARAVCGDEECLSRYTCPEPGCELLVDVRREADGTVTHKPWEDEHPAINRHVMEKQDYCNALEYLNADTYVLPELVDGDGLTEFEIGRTPIELSWQGEDGLLWRVPKSGGSENA